PFLLYASGPHHVLPSSPTRRSSDLAESERALLTRVGPDPDPKRSGSPRDIELENTIRQRNHRYRGAVPIDEIAAHLYREVGCGSDRKSTRLNSSHVKISYAVFCLKK